MFLDVLGRGGFGKVYKLFIEFFKILDENEYILNRYGR
jgi:hypothetical protein